MRTFRKHLAIGLLCGVVAALFSLTPLAELAECKSYDLFHSWKRPSDAPGGVVLVAIDEPSFAELGLQWPWPRSLHGKLVDSLSRAGASAIGFDIIFAEPSRPSEDAAFAEATRRAGNVVLASDASVTEGAQFDQVMAVEPIGLLKQQARIGLVAVQLDRDFVVRKLPRRISQEPLFSETLVAASGKKPAANAEGAYISYASPPNSVRTVSYYQALDPGHYLPKDIFKGKIVIVGPTTSSSAEPEKGVVDYFATPFLMMGAGKSRLMSGIELHANLLEGFLAGKFVTRVGVTTQVAAILFIGLLAGLLQFGWKPVRSGLLSLAALLALVCAAYLLFDRARYWAPVFSLTVPVVLSYAVFGADAYVHAERRRREVKRAFSHYLSPAVLDAVLARPETLRLGGAKVEATIFFSDIADFTTISEKNPPEVVSQLLNRYMTAMTRTITEHWGTIDKFIGDAIMAFWGAPLNDPEHALNACRAAVAMRDRLSSLNAELRQSGLPEVAFRIGINTGEVIAGNMGSEDLFDYTVVGDAVNLASRLEGANKQFGTDILISSFTYDLVRGRVEAKPLGEIKVKGKAQAIAVYALLGVINAGATGAPRMAQ